jgi:hypothetical protein
MVWGGVAMNEIEERAYLYATGQGATWATAMDFAKWYWVYGRNGVGESWREWSRLKSLDLTDDATCQAFDTSLGVSRPGHDLEAVDLIREQFRRDEQ